MAFARPTLSELVDRIQSDFVSRLETAGALLRRSMAFVLARVLAGAAHMLHGHLDYLSKQLFPDLSDEVFLVRQASVFGITQKAPQFASGNVTFTGTNGTVIDEGTVLVRSDSQEYTTDAEVTISAGTATASVTASLAGEDGNADVGVALSFESPVSGADATVLVATGGLSNGSDTEALEDFRTRLLDRLRNPPHGGNPTDYVAWAKEVEGVTRAWVYPRELGIGTVTVRFVRDGDAGPIPDTGEVSAVQDHLDEVAPVQAQVTVVAPIADPLDFDLSITPDNSDTRAAVQAELEDLILRTCEPGGVLLLSDIETSVKNASGVTDRVVNAPVADVSESTGYLTTMGNITWT